MTEAQKKFSEEQKESALKQRQYEKDIETKNYHNDVRVIRKNVQHFFWISIISIISTIIFLLF